ncbi:hypothetical protein DEO72_LG5g1933 [Vigna unguiculata]|uniref:Uncharacterized protein n=1 Tax=Vigna unguiculata TaxID=3917 RepID=A0A4D6LYU7_VIGUN|nr:hypothetical protein DEO72_LG5g1933 [Vigna unguiculata]
MTTNYHDNEDADERDDDASERDRGTSEREQTRTTTSTSHTRDAMTNLIFSYQSVIEEHQCSFVVVSLQNTEVPSLLHHRSTVAQASSIVVVVVEVAEPPLSPFNLACRLFCDADEMNGGVVKLFRRDVMVEDGGDGTLAAFTV